jgi:hypothetical protein
MKRLLFVLVIVGALAYLAGTGELGFFLDSFRPDRESDIPAEFRGSYVLDPAISARLIRSVRSLNPDIVERVTKLTKEGRLQIQRASIVSRNKNSHASTQIGFKVIDRGPGWVVIQSTTRSDALGYAVLLRLDKAADGFWLSGQRTSKNARLLFKKVN